MRIKYLILHLLIILPLSLAHAKVADLKPADIHLKVNEFLHNHISQKKLTPEIMERAISNFIDYLDPLKLYFTEEEVKEWQNPSSESLENTLSSFYKSDFTPFEAIYSKMLEAIERRNQFEKEILADSPLKDVSMKEVEEKKWPLNEKELKEKLLKIHSLQSQYSEKLSNDFKDKFFLLVEKRRKWREKDIIGSQVEEQKPILYSFILKSIATALDSQTDYYPPEEASAILMQVQQRLLGIGVKLIDDFTGFRIIEVLEGGPAKLQGELLAGDRIIAVDKTPVVDLHIYQAVQLIQGKENTPVTLTVLRDEEGEETKTLDITINRGGIVLDETRLQTSIEPYADGVIAHLTLHSFYQDPTSSCSEDVYNEIARLKEEYHLKGIILDLRNNSGGLLVQGVAITSFFIGNGVVASTKQYDGTILHYRNEQKKILWDGPLIVLMNKASASAAEIVAQSLQDYGRAIVVGDTCSFGKGTYQITSILPTASSVNSKGEYKITQGMYYTVSGKTPQLNGVQSDIIAPSYLSEVEYGEKYSKYPVPNSSIEASYDDKLLDLYPWQRHFYKKSYLANLQTKMKTYSKHLAVLKENSTTRQTQNPDYQQFLKVLKEEKEERETSELEVAKNDLQLIETINIMKDLIYLCEKELQSTP